MLEALRASLTEATRLRARAFEFVRTWMASRFDDAKEVRVELAFTGEASSRPPVTLPEAPVRREPGRP